MHQLGCMSLVAITRNSSWLRGQTSQKATTVIKVVAITRRKMRIALASKNPAKEPDHSHDGHDSESCVICQSLGVPNGVAWKLELLSIVRLDFDIAKIPAFVAPESTSLSIPQPRGPPAQLA